MVRLIISIVSHLRIGFLVTLFGFSRNEEEKLPVHVHGVSEKIVGVLGGGQLGRMLCQAASEMAIKVAILDPSENCPASSLSDYHMVGSFNDSATVEEFAKRLVLPFSTLIGTSHLFAVYIPSLKAYMSSLWLDVMF